jgi:serine/threonine-protein kinase
MGEVYQAKDLKLGRDVAIKVLPDEFAKDADRVARFQREAKLLASLNHPNIAAIYGLEESGGTNFLVLELVEGETLADQIKRGPIPVEESLKLALQIAEALEAAHEKGVIHRDLKPANIKVTPEGRVKVLDFGLAKAFAGEQEQLNLSNSPTLSAAATQQGIILGTAAYMSPEQAKGKAVDKRADVFAFGVVLFEMLTGRQLFTGETVSETLAAVLMREPEWELLPPRLHPRIRFLLQRCLEKSAKNRYGSISDARVDIEAIIADPGGVFAQAVAGAEAQTKLRQMLPWIVAAVLLTAIIAGAAVWMLKPLPERQVVRFDYEVPEGEQLLPELMLAVSPNGRQFVYSTTDGLYLRSADQMTAKLIPGTEETPLAPCFSPDGKWIAYRADKDKKLKKIPVIGGEPIVLCDYAAGTSIDWSIENTIVYGVPDGIMRIPARGGTPDYVAKARSFLAGLPQMLPDGKSLLYLDFGGQPLQGKIVVKSLPSGERKELLTGMKARYIPTGHLVYSLVNGNDILAVPFNLDRLEVTGEPVRMVQGISGLYGNYAVSDAGTLVYVPGKKATASVARRTLVWVDRNGKEEQLGTPPNAYAYPRISPDGTRVALSIGSENRANIWTWDLVRKAPARLTFDETVDISALWTSDGKRIAYYIVGDGKRGIHWKSADGTGKEEPLGKLQDLTVFPSSWSADGKGLVFEGINYTEVLRKIYKDDSSGFSLKTAFAGAITGGQNPLATEGAQTNISMLSIEGSRDSKALLKGEKYVVANAQLSRDGLWLAYLSSESGQAEIYVCPFPQVDSGKWQVSTGGGTEPRWSPDGRELFYRNGEAMMAVSIQTAPAFRAEMPKKLFQGSYYSLIGHMWDLSPDGKRFLMIKEAQQTAKAPAAESPRRINIVLNWLDELKQRVPVK